MVVAGFSGVARSLSVTARIADVSPRRAGLRVRRRPAGLAVFVVKACVAAPGLALRGQVCCLDAAVVGSRPVRAGAGSAVRVSRARAVEAALERWRHRSGSTWGGSLGVASVQGAWSLAMGFVPSSVSEVSGRSPSACCLAMATSRERVGQLDTGSFCIASLTGGHGFACVCHHSEPRFASVRATRSTGEVVR